MPNSNPNLFPSPTHIHVSKLSLVTAFPYQYFATYLIRYLIESLISSVIFRILSLVCHFVTAFLDHVIR